MIVTSANAVRVFAERLFERYKHIVDLTVLDQPHDMTRTGASWVWNPGDLGLPPPAVFRAIFGRCTVNEGADLLFDHPYDMPFQTASIGPATAGVLNQIGVAPKIVPDRSVAEDLATALLPHGLQPDGTPTKFLLVRAEEAREVLPEALRAAGAEVVIAPAYRTVLAEGSITALQQLFAGRDHPAPTPSPSPVHPAPAICSPCARQRG